MSTKNSRTITGLTARVAGASMALAFSLTACGANDPAPTGATSSTPTTSSSSQTTATTVGDPVRDAIIASMQGQSPTIAELARNEDATVRELPVSALKGWKVLELSLATPPRPRRATIGLADDGRAVILMGQPASFATVVEGAQVTTDQQALELVQAYVESTGNLAQPSYPVKSFDEVKFLPKPNADQAAQIAAAKKDHGSSVTAPSASKSAAGWTVVSWWATGRQLVKHEVTVAADGTLTDAPTVVADRLPVPVSP